jgi:hypothetical protein
MEAFMGQVKTREPQRGLTFEDVWAMFQETDRKFQETDRQFKETREQMKETDRRFKETDRKISKLGSRIGELIEQLTESNILEKFRALGYKFTQVSRNHEIEDEQGRFLAEIDLLLENGDCVMVVEVKSLFNRTDVKEHIKRLKTLRNYADKHNDTRRYGAAVAGVLYAKNVKEYALENGMYVIEQTGDTVQIKAPEKPYFW